MRGGDESGSTGSDDALYRVPDLAVILRGDALARDRELYSSACDVLRSLDAYRRPPAPRVLDAIAALTLDVARQRVQDPTFARVFGEYRDVVLRHEEASARRLSVLASTARTLLRLRERASVVAVIDRMLEELGWFVAREWNTDLDLDGRDRDWALRAVRRYDLLPPKLRHV